VGTVGAGSHIPRRGRQDRQLQPTGRREYIDGTEDELSAGNSRVVLREHIPIATSSRQRQQSDPTVRPSTCRSAAVRRLTDSLAVDSDGNGSPSPLRTPFEYSCDALFASLLQHRHSVPWCSLHRFRSTSAVAFLWRHHGRLRRRFDVGNYRSAGCRFAGAGLWPFVLLLLPFFWI